MKTNHRINFFCIGAQKSGTTTLHDILKHHPDIFLPQDKEAHFFDFEDRYKRGVSWYENEFFQSSNNQKIIGSITPEYMFFPKVANRIYEDIGEDVKFVVVLRNPVKRALSQYKMSRRRGLEKLSFQLAIERESERVLVDEYHFKNFSYISRGYYFQQLQPYFELFGRTNTLVLIFENDIVKNLPKSIEKITDFLEIERTQFNGDVKSNEGNGSALPFVNRIIYGNGFPKKLFRRIIKNDATKRFLVKKIEKFNQFKPKNIKPVVLNETEERKIYLKYFREEIELLETNLGIDLSIWKYQTKNHK